MQIRCLEAPAGLNGRIFACRACKTHLATTDLIESKNFNRRTGPAYLFTHAFNILWGPPKRVSLKSGWHTVSYVSCVGCRRELGWKYMVAEEPDKRYKVGKVILEKALWIELKDDPSSGHLGACSRDCI